MYENAHICHTYFYCGFFGIDQIILVTNIMSLSVFEWNYITIWKNALIYIQNDVIYCHVKYIVHCAIYTGNLSNDVIEITVINVFSQSFRSNQRDLLCSCPFSVTNTNCLIFGYLLKRTTLETGSWYSTELFYWK